MLRALWAKLTHGPDATRRPVGERQELNDVLAESARLNVAAREVVRRARAERGRTQHPIEADFFPERTKRKGGEQ